ncbi:MAG: DNA-directed RNA polymerase subunit omega [Clostridium sp.]
MILEPTLTQLLKQIPDKFELITTISKRTRELKGGADKLTRFDHDNYITIVAKEISEGLVHSAKKRTDNFNLG